MQPLQKPFPQQYLQQQQPPFPGKTSVLVQNQLHRQLPMQSQLCPQVPPHSVQQNSHAYLQPQQNVAHGMQPHQSQNYVGRPMIPNHAGHSHPFPQSPRAAQVRPMQLAANQPSAEARTLKSGTGVKSMDDGQKLVGGDRDTSQVGTLAKDTDCVSQTAENGSAEPAIKPMMKDGTKHDLEPSPGGKSVEIVAEEQKDANDVPKQEDHFSVDDSSLQQAKSFKEQRGKLPKDAVVPVSTGTNKGSQALPAASAHIPDSSTPDVTPQGNSRTPLTGRDPSQHGYQERNLSQSQFTPQGPGVDEFRGFPPHGPVQGKGFGHPAPVADQGRHQQLLMQYGPSSHQQRPFAPSMLQPVPPPGPPHQAQVPRRPPILLRPQGLGNLPLAGQPLNSPEHIQPPVKQPYGSLHPEVLLSGIPGPGSTLSFGRGPSHLGPSQRSFELLSSASQGHYNQGHAPLSHAGLPRVSQGEPPVGGVPQGAVPSVSSDLHSGIMGRAQLHDPESQFGQHRHINPTETESFSNLGSHHFDARKPDPQLPETSESGPFGPPPGFESNVMRMNGPPGLDSISAPGLQDERSRPLSGDHFPMEPARRLDRGEFEDLKQFPRHSHLDTDPAPKFGSNFSTSTPIDRGACGFIADVASRPLDKAPLGLNYDAGLKLEPGAGGVPSRFLPPYLPADTLHPNDAGEKTYMAGLDDNVGRADISRNHPDFRDAIARFGQHPRSPGGEKLGLPTRGVGGLSGVPRNQSGLDDVDGRESHPFGQGPISFSLPSDPVGNSFHESRLPALPSHLRRGELDGQDILPRHLWRG
ncbi:hypothetical protein F0562_022027 [Nyssa sinensis]|uniref:Uncharacterized protein n=1 Tax=Nyssa sinensis TaxID=561372 RepID=A0A5J5BMC8_9ASTE|nr:hypothetical protein F0562_022027 [Nyssa sinensis]